MIKEHEEILTSLNADTLEKMGGWFGTNVRPEFVDVVPMRTLDPALLPSPERTKGHKSSRRLVIVGDVHGCQDECKSICPIERHACAILINLRSGEPIEESIL